MRSYILSDPDSASKNNRVVSQGHPTIVRRLVAWAATFCYGMTDCEAVSAVALKLVVQAVGSERLQQIKTKDSWRYTNGVNGILLIVDVDSV